MPSFEDAIKELNAFKRHKVLRDYVIIGAVAATAYMEPLFTEDIDIIVLVDSDTEFFEVFEALTELADKQENVWHIIKGIQVQLFPTTTKPLYRDTLEDARGARVGNLRVKVASPEHLILLFLERNSSKDKIRVLSLLDKADMDKIYELLERFDDEQSTLAQRLQSLL